MNEGLYLDMFIVNNNSLFNVLFFNKSTGSAAIAVGVVLGLLVIGGVVAGLIYIWYRSK